MHVAFADGLSGVTAVPVLQGELPNFGELFPDCAEALAARVEQARFMGKRRETLVLDVLGDDLDRIVLVGMGKAKKVTALHWRDFGAEAVRAAHDIRSAECTLHFADDVTEMGVEQAITGAFMGDWRFYTPKLKKNVPPPPSVDVLQIHGVRFDGVIDRAQMRADCVNRARQWGNDDPETHNPGQVAQLAMDFAEAHDDVTCTIHEADDLQTMGAGGLYAVGKGAIPRGPDFAPRMVHLHYKPEGALGAPIAVVGKYIVFDIGGGALKSKDGQCEMHQDMMGGAATLAGFMLCVVMGIPVEIHCLLAVAENAIGPHSYRHTDRITLLDGTVLVVTNTDAEGRVATGDAITHASRIPELAFMLSQMTLTGAQMIATGFSHAGFFFDDEHAELGAMIMAAGQSVGESFWHLPHDCEYAAAGLQTDRGDSTNTGPNKWLGSGRAAMFCMARAQNDVPLLHADIAGPGVGSGKRLGSVDAHAPGFGVQTVLAVAQAWAAKHAA